MATTSDATRRNHQTEYPSLYSIQYPNCQRGFFSLRPPFKEMYEVPVNRPLTPLPAVLPTHSSAKQAPVRQVSKRNAHIQCSLLLPNIRHEVGVQTNLKDEPVADRYSYNDSKSRYRSRSRFPSTESDEEIYEWRQVQSPQPRRERRVNRNAAVLVDDDDDDDSDDDQEHVIYARYPRKARKKTYLPSNVRMICVRDEPTRTFH